MSYTSTILITGGTTGLGYETALSLAHSHVESQIVICSRSGGEAADTINKATGRGNVVYLKLDLETHAGTRSFVDAFNSRTFPPIRALVLNAGIQVIDKVHMTADDIELMFAVNHVNQALLFFLLKSQLTPDAHIVLVSSSTHDPKWKRTPPPNFTTPDAAAHPPIDPKLEIQSEGFRLYARSKLCNVLFAYSLDRHARSANKDWTITGLDPGVMATRLYRHTTGVIGYLFNWFLASSLAKWTFSDSFTPAETAVMLSKLSVDKEFEGKDKSGKYYQVKDPKMVPSSDESYDQKIQEDLWEWTIQKVARDNAEATKFKAL